MLTARCFDCWVVCLFSFPQCWQKDMIIRERFSGVDFRLGAGGKAPCIFFPYFVLWTSRLCPTPPPMLLFWDHFETHSPLLMAALVMKEVYLTDLFLCTLILVYILFPFWMGFIRQFKKRNKSLFIAYHIIICLAHVAQSVFSWWCMCKLYVDTMMFMSVLIFPFVYWSHNRYVQNGSLFFFLSLYNDTNIVMFITKFLLLSLSTRCHKDRFIRHLSLSMSFLLWYDRREFFIILWWVDAQFVFDGHLTMK